jgi:hypothetical protein
VPKSTGVSLNNLRNKDLRPKDIRKLISKKDHELEWDSGIESNNEWVFASLESTKSKNKLLNWLHSKNIDDSNLAIISDPTWNYCKEITFGQLITEPETFFKGTPFKIVDIDLTWTLDYIEQEVARFGRWSINT